MVVNGMAKKNISKKGVSKQAVSKKVVVEKEISAEKISNKKENNEALNTTQQFTPKNKQKVVEVKEMDDFMKEEEVSIKRVALKIWDVVFWVLFVLLICAWVVDFFRVKFEKDPLFCISKEVVEFEDGTVDKCTGLGYKVYTYNRTSLDKGIEFGSFFAKMKEPDTE